jgi:uncharacterized protein (DUF302 family)
MRRILALAIVPATLFAVAARPAPTPAAGPSYSVFLRLVDAPAGAFDQMVAAVAPAVQRAGWQVLASYEAGTGDCAYRAMTFVVNAPDFTAEVLKHGARTAFAVPLRLSVFEDDVGVHLAAVNPQSIARTVVDESFEAPATALVGALRAMTSTGFPGTPVMHPYGQLRDKGLIEKTMGVVAGGPFPDKIDQVRKSRVVPGLTVKVVADNIVAAGAKPTRRWALRNAYRLDLPAQNAVLLGFTGGPMESRSYAIVGPGIDETRAAFACPGLDHTPAYPLELLVVQEGDEVKVLLIDVMFRMKMYFEDAGKMKFAANMSMPGSIENELRDLVEEAY